MTVTLKQYKDYLESLNKNEGSENSVISLYRLWLKKTLSIYGVLNMMKKEGTLLYGLFWVP